jgi:hypothetical protein
MLGTSDQPQQHTASEIKAVEEAKARTMRILGEEPAVQIETRTLSAHDFSSRVTTGDSALMFGTNRAQTVKTLRALADRIEKEEVHVFGARVSSLAPRDEFVTSVLRLVLAEKVMIGKEKTNV